MLLTLKFLTLATLFVGTGGAVFTEWGRRNQVLVVLAGIVAVAAATYLARDIYEDFKRDLREELVNTPSQRGATPKRSIPELEEPARKPTPPKVASEEQPPKSVRPELPASPKNPTPSRVCVLFNGRQVCE